jgi:hypothetical protein
LGRLGAAGTVEINGRSAVNLALQRRELRAQGNRIEGWG